MEEIQFNHTLPIQLRFNDVDKFGHVNNTVYFSFLDTIRQFRRRAAHDALIWVAQPLAHIHRDMAQITLCQRTAQIVDAALAAYQRKEAAGCPHLRQNVVLPPVDALF